VTARENASCAVKRVDCPLTAAPRATGPGAPAAKRMRGAHKNKHAAFGEQHCGCQARFSVTRPCGDSDYVILRMLEREHNHATDTMFAHVSSELRDKAEKAWRKWGHALNFSVIAEKLSEGVPTCASSASMRARRAGNCATAASSAARRLATCAAAIGGARGGAHGAGDELNTRCDAARRGLSAPSSERLRNPQERVSSPACIKAVPAGAFALFLRKWKQGYTASGSAYVHGSGDAAAAAPKQRARKREQSRGLPLLVAQKRRAAKQAHE
jgi:hypothetical protein